MKLFRTTLLLTLFLAAVAGVEAQPAPAPSAGNPSFKLQGLDGKVYDLTELRGNVVLVSFGATWCAPCTTELRALEQILAEYRNKPVRFFWVSIEREEEVSNRDLKRYAKERRVSFRSSLNRDPAPETSKLPGARRPVAEESHPQSGSHTVRGRLVQSRDDAAQLVACLISI